jgi:O-antigen ligase
MTRAPLVPPEMLAATRNRWDAAVEILLAVLLAFLPLAFGGVEAWSELVALALAAALTLMVLARAVFDRTLALPWTWAYLPLGLFALLAAVQMAPLPRGLVEAISPAAARVPAELLGAAAAARPTMLSAYPLATSHGLRLVLLGAAVFFVTVATFRTAPQIRRLLAIVFVIGCAEAALALLQIFTRAGGLYWMVDAGGSRLTSGSFINYSNFSQFMNLAIGAGVALLLVRLLDEHGGGSFRDDAARAFGGARLADHGSLLAGLLLCVVAVCASLSRNGVLSLAAATLVVGLALFRRGALRERGWVLAILPVAALLALLTFGFDAIYERFVTLRDTNQVASRWELTRDVLRAWQAYPVTGAGLGTHEYVFPMYDRSVSPVLAQQADNDYAQLLEETGVLGAVCVAAFLGVIGWQLIAVCRRGRGAISAAAFGLALGLIAVAIHSASDFGQHVPAVFCLSAVTCALIVSLSRLNATRAPSQVFAERLGPRRGVAAALAVGAVLVGAWALRTGYAAHSGEQWWTAALLVDQDIAKAGPDATDADYADLLAAAGQAADIQPANVQYAYWLNAFRWRSLARRVDPATGEILLGADLQPIVARIADELAAARRLCPTYGPPYGLEGQLRLTVLGELPGAELIRQGVRLAPYDPPTCLTAGELAAREGRGAEAATLLRRAVALAPSYFPDAASLALDVLGRPEFARELAGDDYQRLEQLAAIAAADPERTELADEWRRDAESALRQRVETAADTSPRDLAALAARDVAEGNHAGAAELYRRALLSDYGQFDWRFARAQSLIAIGDDAQALREVKTCLTLRPTHDKAKHLADEITVRLAKSKESR